MNFTTHFNERGHLNIQMRNIFHQFFNFVIKNKVTININYAHPFDVDHMTITYNGSNNWGSDLAYRGQLYVELL